MADLKGPIFLYIVPDDFLVSFLRHMKRDYLEKFQYITYSSNISFLGFVIKGA